VTTNEWSPDAARSGYLDALTGVLTLARSLDADEWTLPTDLHAWNVFDNVAHVVAVEDELAGRPVPSSITDWSEFPHVETPYQQYTEVGVNSRRGKAPQELLDELEGLIPERERQLVSTPAEPTAEMRGPAGMVGPVMRVMGTRTLDIWSHEQDVRRATGRPTRMIGPAASASQQRMVQALPQVLAMQSEAPAGTTVRWQIQGHEPAEVVVGVDDDGKGVELDTRDAQAVLSLDREALQILFCGRREPVTLLIDIDGDREIAELAISAFPVTP